MKGYSFESLSIKKNIKDDMHNLYGLVWFESEGKKQLVCIKSNNLKWDYSVNYINNTTYVYGGKTKAPIISYLSREIFQELRFKNLENSETNVIFELNILNGKDDEFMNYNVYEGLEDYRVEINVAGVKKEDIKVILEDEIIKVKVRPSKETLEDDYEVIREEFRTKKQECEIYLPNIMNVNAKYENGILILKAPKESKGIKIEVA